MPIKPDTAPTGREDWSAPQTHKHVCVKGRAGIDAETVGRAQQTASLHLVFVIEAQIPAVVSHCLAT